MKLTQDEIQFLIKALESVNSDDGAITPGEEQHEKPILIEKLQNEVIVRLDNWAVILDPTQIVDPFQAPETLTRCLSGDCYGHPDHADGTRINTSGLIDAYIENDEHFVKTQNRTYRLIQVRPEYAEAFPDWEARLFKKPVLKTGHQWAYEKKIEIMDPDGWRRNDGVDLVHAITEEDVDKRIAVSTVKKSVGEAPMERRMQPMDLGYTACGKDVNGEPCVLEKGHEGKCES
jgi:hypothetical protein